MATTSNVKVVQFGNGPMDNIQMTVATGTVLAFGDFCELTDNTSTAVAATTVTTNGDLFLGPCITGSTSSSNVDITIAILCNVRLPLSSGAMSFGEAATLSAGANGTAWTVSKNAAEGVMWALEEVAVNATGLFRVDLQMMAVCVFEVLTS